MNPTHVLSRLGRVSCVINPLSGSTPADAAALIGEKLSGLADPVAIFTVGEGDLAGQMAAALAEAPDTLIVWGGDGTIACALSHAGEQGPAVLPLPGGTMNMLPTRALGGDHGWDALIDRALRGGHVRPMPCGEIAGGPRFFVAAMLGDMTRFTNSREALREGKLLEAAEIVHDTTALALNSNIVWTVPGQPPQVATALTVNINPDTAGKLEIATIDPEGLLDLARLGLEVLNDGWRKAEDVALTLAEEVEAHQTEKGRISVTLDGELHEMETPLRFRRIEAAVNIFVPDMS
ncbi:MAG: diacylglycerol kinase family protein [Hyphomonas sp.]|nr:diacylglycerol kinase family protein [Hyphomonas sp.]